jgi:glycosyltransferase involved in cell wall biosynthesis
MLEVDALQAYVTTYAFRNHGLVGLLLKKILTDMLKRNALQLERRAIEEIPAHYVHSHPMWEILRSVAQKTGASPAFVDVLWDQSAYSFDAIVARRYVSQADAIQAFEYTALASFRRAKEEGVARILHVPSLDSAQFREIQRRERDEWKELRGEYDGYFERKFAQRYKRRQHEIVLADVIVANSSLTARSHISAGADPAKIYVAALGAPPPIPEIRIAHGRQREPLRVLFAGSFDLRKGAHYLLKAWQALKAGPAAVLNVYGRVELPNRMLATAPDSIVWHGSVPRPVLFSAYETADVLVFPTLSDGFGSVVAEALAHGLPVITTDQAGAAALLTPECGFIVSAANSDALVDVLRWCLDNRERLLGMRSKAIEAARRRQWSDFRRDLITVLADGLRSKGYESSFRRTH